MIALEAQPKADFLGALGSTIALTSTSESKLKLCAYRWPAAGAVKGILTLCHGHGSYLCFDYLSDKGPGQLHTYEGSWVDMLNRSGARWPLDKKALNPGLAVSHIDIPYTLLF